MAGLAPIIAIAAAITHAMPAPTGVSSETHAIRVEQAVERAATIPVVANALNLEHPLQSRILWGQIIQGLSPVLGALGYQLDDARTALIAAGVSWLIGIAYTLYGRFKTGLKPLFSRRE